MEASIESESFLRRVRAHALAHSLSPILLSQSLYAPACSRPSSRLWIACRTQAGARSCPVPTTQPPAPSLGAGSPMSSSKPGGPWFQSWPCHPKEESRLRGPGFGFHLLVCTQPVYPALATLRCHLPPWACNHLTPGSDPGNVTSPTIVHRARARHAATDSSTADMFGWGFRLPQG